MIPKDPPWFKHGNVKPTLVAPNVAENGGGLYFDLPGRSVVGMGSQCRECRTTRIQIWAPTWFGIPSHSFGRRNIVSGRRDEVLGCKNDNFGRRHRVWGAKIPISDGEILFWVPEFQFRAAKPDFGRQIIDFGRRNRVLGANILISGCEICF